MLTTNLPRPRTQDGEQVGQAWVQGAAWRWGPPALAQPGEEAAEEQLVLAGSPARVSPQTPRSLRLPRLALHTPMVFGFCFYLVADSES